MPALRLTCSICGQAPSVHPEYAERLVGGGIDSISVNVDAIDRTRRNVAVAGNKRTARGSGPGPSRPCRAKRPALISGIAD